MKKQSLSFFGLAITLLTAFSVNATEVAINNLKAGGLADSLTVRSIDQTKVTKLTLSGNVNGADVIVIRRMAGCNETGGETDGYALSELDMTGSNIVEGGGKYLTDDAQHEYFTENKVIGKYFFYNCKNLKKYTFPASVKSMVGYAFFQNDSVRIVRFPESSVCTDLGFRAFSECESLSSITLPEQISKIPDECFYFTPDLTQISIPENVKEIGLGAFAKSGITSLTLPSQIDSIGEGAFQNCVHLAGTIHLPGSLRAIDGSVFLADTSLVAFEIDPSSTSMSTDANGFLFNANPLCI